MAFTAADYLIGQIYGRHFDRCPECGREFPCNIWQDCQRVNLCVRCYLDSPEGEMEQQFLREEFGLDTD